MLNYFGGPKHLLVDINLSLTKCLTIFRMVCEIIVFWHDPCSSLGATTLWVLAFSTNLLHSSLFIAILLQFWIFTSRICCDIIPHPKLRIPILLTAIMIHVGEVFIMRGFGIPPGCSCDLHSSGMLRGTTSKKSEGRKSASLHYFRLREAASVGRFTCLWNEVHSITKTDSVQ